LDRTAETGKFGGRGTKSSGNRILGRPKPGEIGGKVMCRGAENGSGLSRSSRGPRTKPLRGVGRGGAGFRRRSGAPRGVRESAGGKKGGQPWGNAGAGGGRGSPENSICPEASPSQSRAPVAAARVSVDEAGVFTNIGRIKGPPGEQCYSWVRHQGDRGGAGIRGHGFRGRKPGGVGGYGPGWAGAKCLPRWQSLREGIRFWRRRGGGRQP